jgi:hypothetical protein
MKTVKVHNMTSPKGSAVPNQFIIETADGCYFQSYNTVNKRIQLDINSWDFSITTGKYRNLFLGETKAETQKKIDSGEYELIDLN